MLSYFLLFPLLLFFLILRFDIFKYCSFEKGQCVMFCEKYRIAGHEWNFVFNPEDKLYFFSSRCDLMTQQNSMVTWHGLHNKHRMARMARMHSSRMSTVGSSSRLLGSSASVHAGTHPQGLFLDTPKVWAWRLPLPCGQNSWHTLLKILPCPNFVADGNNLLWISCYKTIKINWYQICD